MVDEDEKTVGIHSHCHTFFSPNEGELEDHLKMLLDYFFDTHNAIKEYMNQLGNTAVAEEEKKEQAELRQEYLAAVRKNLRAQLNNIDIQEKDGSIVNLGEKYGRKKGN